MTLQEKDLLLIVDYVDGRLSSEEMVGLEIRFSNEPELAAAYDSFDTIDGLQREVALAQVRPKGFRLLRGGRHLRPVAAAALLLVAASLFLTRDAQRPLATGIALVPSGIAWSDFNRALDVDGTWGDRTPNVRRASGEPEFPHREYFDQVSPIQDARFERALAEMSAPPPMYYFNVVLRPESACSALVLIADATGQVVDHEGNPQAPAFPTGDPWTADSGRLAAGLLEVLPRRNLVWNDADKRVDPYEAGFLVPLQSIRLEVFIGLREQPFDDGLKESLDSMLSDLSAGPRSAETTSRTLQAWMNEQGFEIVKTTADERQD